MKSVASAQFGLSVQTERSATKRQRKEVRAVFSRRNLDVAVKPELAFRSAEPGWLVVITASSTAVLVELVRGFAAAAGADAWHELTHPVQEIREVYKSEPPGCVVIKDTDGRLSITVNGRHPNELTPPPELNLLDLPSGALWWTDHDGWRFQPDTGPRDERDV